MPQGNRGSDTCSIVIMRLQFAVALILFSNSAFAQFKFRWTIPVADGLTIWAISAIDQNVAWIAANKGTVGRAAKDARDPKNWTFNPVKEFENKEFRSIYAFNEHEAVIANVGSPASILRTIDGGLTWQEVYRNESPDAFIDGIDFWNDRNGLVYGDPINGRMLLLRTTDGGRSWTEIPEHSRPALSKGEASFASSGTGIRCLDGGTAVIATGGLVSRVFYSKDMGENWAPSEPMLKQGSPTGGIFSIARQKNGGLVLVGGDFQDSLETVVAIYQDEHGEWKAPSKPPRGTRWCVEATDEFADYYVTIAVGPSGADLTKDGGKTWEELLPGRGFHVVRKSRKGDVVIIGGKNQLLLLD
jgi:photosystem II stability/assembly factor-like uncharacterized protein